VNFREKLHSCETRLLPMVLRLVASALAVSLLLAQEPEGPTFRANTQLVQVDVVVKSKGVPITGLTKDDFEVLDNGKPQKIAVFSLRDVKNITSTPQPLAPGVVSNRPVSRGPEPVSGTVLLLDSVNTAEENEVYVRDQVLKYLDKANRSEWIAVYFLHIHLDVLQDFTLDREKLRAAVKKFRPTQEFIPWPGDTTKKALQIIARNMEGLPGRKKLIWMSSASIPALQVNPAQVKGISESMRDLFDAKNFSPLALFNNANVAVYMINPRGVAVRGPGLRDRSIGTNRDFAEATGGKSSYIMDNDVAAEMEEAFADTDITYTLGFYPSNSDSPGAPHSIQVKVQPQGIEARYRSSYLAEKPPQPMTPKDRTGKLDNWMLMPLNMTDIPVQARADPVSGKPGYFDVSVLIDVSAVRLEERNGRFEGIIELAVAPDRGEEKTKGLRETIRLSYTPQRLAETMETGGIIKGQIQAAGTNGKLISKRLHVVVMDNNTGKAGSVRIPIQ
jgi:VWFA-related protein